jgi:hypothetical protein
MILEDGGGKGGIKLSSQNALYAPDIVMPEGTGYLKSTLDNVCRKYYRPESNPSYSTSKNSSGRS